MGHPDMRNCIKYAATAPHTHKAGGERLDLTQIGSLTFDRPDTEAFPLLDAARAAIRTGGTCPASLIAADEEAVDAFLKEKIGFDEISSLVLETLGKVPVSYEISAESVADAVRVSRRICASLIG